MSILEEERQKINRIDAQMAELFNARMRAVDTVAAYKNLCGIPVLDDSREAEVLSLHSAKVEECFRPYYISFLKYLMGLSRRYQQNKITGASLTEGEEELNTDGFSAAGTISKTADKDDGAAKSKGGK